MKTPTLIIVALWTCFCAIAWSADADHPRLSIDFEKDVSSTQFFISVFEVKSQRLMKIGPPAEKHVAAKHTVILPSDVSGDCIVFIDAEILAIGAQHHRITCKSGEVSVIKAQVGQSQLAMKFPPSVKSAAIKGDIAVYLFQLTDQGVDPFFLVANSVHPRTAEALTLDLCGVQTGRYLLTVVDLDNAQPLYSRAIELPPEAIRFDLWPFSNGKAPTVEIEFGPSDAFRGIVAPLPTNRGWWSSLWMVDGSDGTVDLIDNRQSGSGTKTEPDDK